MLTCVSSQSLWLICRFLFFYFLGTGTSREQRQIAAAAAGNGANSDVDGVFNPSASSSSSYVLHQRHWKGKQQQALPVTATAANLLLNSEDVKAEGDDDEYDDDSQEDEEEEDYLADESSSSLNGFRWPPESYFDLEASSDVTVVVGQAAFLVCRVAVAGNWTVSTLFVCRP